MHANSSFRGLQWTAALSLATVLTVGGCRGGKIDRTYEINTGGDSARGRSIIRQKGCPSCHMIPGIRPASGMVGPPLRGFARRTYIAGVLPNSRNNLVRWIRSPQSIEPGVAMPDLGLSEQDAKDVAAYLYTLR